MVARQKKFKHYYCQYKDKIFTYFYYRVNFNQALAEDLTSDVFIKALKAFKRFDADKSFQAWIYAIARNHLINHYRVATREVKLELILEIPDESLKLMDISLECEDVIKAMHNLKPYHRDALLMRFIDGLSNEEIALVLCKDPGTVRTQLSRALTILRQACKQYE